MLDFFLGSLAVNRAAGHVNSDKLLAAGWDDAAAGAITITASQCLFAFGLGLIFATALYLYVRPWRVVQTAL